MERTREKISAQIEGKTYAAWCVVDGSLVTVSTPLFGKQTTQIGGSPPATLARIMLAEMVRNPKISCTMPLRPARCAAGTLVREENMKQLTLGIVAASTLVLGVALPGAARAQVSKEKFVGTWTLVSAKYNQDGKIRDIAGPNPSGLMMVDAGGRFIQIIMRPDLPKFASNNRESGTPEENKAVVQGSVAYFGTYTAAGGDVSLHIDNATFPNWKGADQKRSISLEGDQLKWVNTASTVGSGGAELIWKRVK